MSWDEITDAEVAAYAPITARLLTKLRDNIQTANANMLSGCMPSFFERTAVNGTDEGVWIDYPIDLDLWVPDAAISPAGSALHLRAWFQVQNNSKAISVVADYRLKVGAAVSNEVTVVNGSINNTVTTEQDFDIVLPTTVMGFYSITVQTNVTLDEISPLGTTDVRFQVGTERTDGLLVAA